MLKGAATWFVNHVFVREGVEFGDYVMSGLAADEETAQGPNVPDSEAGGVVSAAKEFS